MCSHIIIIVQNLKVNMMYKWTVIGAGPAGIAAIAKLLDSNIAPKEIMWLDTQFKVGDFGHKWGKVSSNTKIKNFTKYFESFESINISDLKNNFKLFDLDPEITCDLDIVAEALQFVTKHFCELVDHTTTNVSNLEYINNQWEITTSHDDIIMTKKVILATGAKPKKLNYNIKTIALDQCFNKDLLKYNLSTDDTIAVFGSSHSAVLVLKNLVDLNIKRIINFYRSPLKYAIEMQDCILYDNTGLKGIAAKWAKENLSNSHSCKIERYLSNNQNIDLFLNKCDKAIYAIGFDRHNDIKIAGLDNHHDYDNHTGIIAPGLFGFGIAYPELVTNKYGVTEHSVGLLKFANYINNVMQIWLKYD